MGSFGLSSLPRTISQLESESGKSGESGKGSEGAGSDSSEGRDSTALY